jgi:hypothetical protein
MLISDLALQARNPVRLSTSPQTTSLNGLDEGPMPFRALSRAEAPLARLPVFARAPEKLVKAIRISAMCELCRT